MNKLIHQSIVTFTLFICPIFSTELGVIQSGKQGLKHPKSALTIERMTPGHGHHKNSITLSNGVKYKIYPFHGWDLDHWKAGQQVKLEQSRDLLYKTKLVNLEVGDSISVKRKVALR